MRKVRDFPHIRRHSRRKTLVYLSNSVLSPRWHTTGIKGSNPEGLPYAHHCEIVEYLGLKRATAYRLTNPNRCHDLSAKLFRSRAGSLSLAREAHFCRLPQPKSGPPPPNRRRGAAWPKSCAASVVRPATAWTTGTAAVSLSGSGVGEGRLRSSAPSISTPGVGPIVLVRWRRTFMPAVTARCSRLRTRIRRLLPLAPSDPPINRTTHAASS